MHLYWGGGQDEKVKDDWPLNVDNVNNDLTNHQNPLTTTPTNPLQIPPRYLMIFTSFMLPNLEKYSLISSASAWRHHRHTTKLRSVFVHTWWHDFFCTVFNSSVCICETNLHVNATDKQCVWSQLSLGEDEAIWELAGWRRAVEILEGRNDVITWPNHHEAEL